MRRGEAHRCGEAQRRQLRRIEAGNIYVNRNMIGATRSAISTARPR
jgi:delta 1-pyrroline-5-carboxylate dehydrogenase